MTDEDILSRTDFDRLTELAGLTFSREILPPDRRRALDEAGFPWLTLEIAATDQACARIQACRANGPPADDRQTRIELADHVAIVGEAALEPLVREMVAQLPAPMIAHAIQTVVVFACGKTLRRHAGRDPRRADALSAARLGDER